MTGGFARSVVNFDAGAETPATGAMTSVGIAIEALFLTPLLASPPIATLAATIIVAVLSLINFAAIRNVLRYSRADFAAMATTNLVTLGFGVEPLVVAGVLLSLALLFARTSRPHTAIVGRVPRCGSEILVEVARQRIELIGKGNVAVVMVAVRVFGTKTAGPDLIVAAIMTGLGITGGIQIICQATREISAFRQRSIFRPPVK